MSTNVFTKLFRRGRTPRKDRCPSVKRRTAHQPDRFRPAFEGLENRCCPSCTTSVINGVLTVNCDNNLNEVSVEHGQGYAIINGSQFSDGTYNSIQIYGGSGGLRTLIQANVKPLALFGRHQGDTVQIGYPGKTLDRIQAPLDLENPSHNNNVFLHDEIDPNPSHTGTINVVTIGGSQFEQVTGLGASAPINAKVADTADLEVNGGAGGPAINVIATACLTVVVPHGPSLVTVGNAGRVAGIVGNLEVGQFTNPPRLVVDDSADTGNRSVQITPDGPRGAQIQGLAPASISYFTQIHTVIRTGTGTETITVEQTPPDPQGSTTIEGHSSNTTVNVGFNNSLANIQGPLTITNPPSYTHVNINDSADNGDHGNISLTATSLTGLAPAAITFGSNDLASLTITGGGGTNVYNVFTTQNSGVPGGNLTTLNTGSRADTVYVLGDSGAGLVINGGFGPDFVNLGSNYALLGIVRPVTINNSVGSVQVNVNDQPDLDSHPNTRLSLGGLTGLAPAPINFGPSAVTNLTINDGRGNDTYTIAGCPLTSVLNAGPGTDVIYVQGLPAFAHLTLNTAAGSGADTVILGDASQTLSGLSGVLSSITLNGKPGDALVVNDQGYTNVRNYSLTPTTLTWTNGPQVGYRGLTWTTVNGSQGNDTFDLSAGTAVSNGVVLYGGGGSNTLIGSNSGNTWLITGPAPDTGYLQGPAYGGSVTFVRIGNLTGGTGGDTFRFSDQATLSGNLVGGGNATLDYSQYSTSVIVDLQNGFATGVGSSISGIVSVIGGSGAPGTPGLYNLLIGNGGNTLTGGTGRRNILVAGGSASTLIAGEMEDLLIGGSTIYDNDPTDPTLQNWQAIAAYWAGTDDYFTRVANLTSGNGVPLLDATTVTGNSGGNTMTGTGALALIYSDGMDNISGFDPNSIIVPITP